VTAGRDRMVDGEAPELRPMRARRIAFRLDCHGLGLIAAEPRAYDSASLLAIEQPKYRLAA
jgi:hypothetical protein